MGRIDDSTLLNVYAAIPAGDLLTLAGNGDIAAAQALAELSMSSDNKSPPEAHRMVPTGRKLWLGVRHVQPKRTAADIC